MTATVEVAGIFVGGASSRMGGRPKGLLRTRDGATVVERAVALAKGVARGVVLVGRAEAYAHLGVESIVDASGGEGPIAGLVALLDRANGGDAIVLACDMPYVTSAMITKLASWAPGAPAVAPRDGRAWSALFARYDSRAALSAARTRMNERAGPSAVLDALDARELPLDDDERRALRDWDAPEDVDA